jgi:hypothetical protein
MNKRQAIGKKLRFEVFKRDGFKCQYCGKSAPDVVLHVDHINPVSHGGQNGILNLITSCLDCNLGKSDRLLDDDSAVAKQREQLQALSERREQLKMMLEWRDGLQKIDDEALEAACDAWATIVPGWSVNDRGQKILRGLLRKYGLPLLLQGMDDATYYVKYDKDGKIYPDSVERAFSKISAILRVKGEPQWKQELYYIRGILRNRIYTSTYAWKVMQMMEDAVLSGVDVDIIRKMAQECRNWSQFEDWITDATKSANEA